MVTTLSPAELWLSRVNTLHAADSPYYDRVQRLRWTYRDTEMIGGGGGGGICSTK